MTEPKKDKKKQHIGVYLIPVIIFLAFIFFMMIWSFPGKVKDTITNTKLSFQSLGTLSDTFEGTLQGNIFAKNQYINLNGLTTRVLGINTLNERYRLDNGYLARTENAKDTREYSNNVIELNDFLAERGIDFLYLQAPSKETFYDAEFRPGYSSDGWKTINSMVDSLTAAEVSTLDMNAWFKENDLDMEDVFFKTDHHWTPQAGLEAAKATMEILAQNDEVSYNEELLDEDNYNIEILENWFLGSAGKRVGRYYGGVDDISIYFPSFATNYTFAGFNDTDQNWIYSDSPLDLTYLEGKDYFESNPYCIYMYNINPMQIVKNTEAANDKRILIVGDSFMMPMEYFLTTQFQEVYTIALEYYTDGTLAEYIEEIQPDIVLMCTNPSKVDEANFTFGIDEYQSTLDSSLTNNAQVSILSSASVEAQEENDNNFVVLCDNLEPNQTYTLTIDSATYSGGEDLFVQMSLQNLSSNESIYNRYFDANSDETQKWIFTTPEDMTGNYAVYLYAGTKGNTANASAKVTGVTLQKGVIEN